MDKLKPCPFCGNTNVKWQEVRHSVVCLYCEAFGPSSDAEVNAIKEWNTRVTDRV